MTATETAHVVTIEPAAWMSIQAAYGALEASKIRLEDRKGVRTAAKEALTDADESLETHIDEMEQTEDVGEQHTEMLFKLHTTKTRRREAYHAADREYKSQHKQVDKLRERLDHLIGEARDPRLPYDAATDPDDLWKIVRLRDITGGPADGDESAGGWPARSLEEMGVDTVGKYVVSRELDIKQKVIDEALPESVVETLDRAMYEYLDRINWTQAWQGSVPKGCQLGLNRSGEDE